MARPDGRSRTQGKFLQRCRERSLSASDVHNSPFYEKYVLFERLCNNVVSTANVRANDSEASTLDVKVDNSVLQASVTHPFPKNHAQLDTSRSTSNIKQDDNVLHASVGNQLLMDREQLDSLRTQQETPHHPTASSAVQTSSIILSLRRPNNTKRASSHQRSSHSSVIRNQTKPLSFLNIITSNTQESIQSHNDSVSAFHEQHSFPEPVQRQKEHLTVKKSASEPYLLYQSITVCGTSSGSSQSSNYSLTSPTFYSTPGSHLHSRVCQTSCSVSIQPLNYTSNVLSHGSVHDHQLIAAPVSDTRCSSRSSSPLTKTSREASVGFSTSAAASSETAAGEDGESTINKPREVFEASLRKTSTASINLSKIGDASVIVATKRKIHVLKARHSVPYLTQEPSVRLDEWLSSVMKLQVEQEQTQSVIFPEDESDASSYHVTLRTSQTQTTNQVNVFMPSPDNHTSSDARRSATSIDMRRSSTDINTGITFAPKVIHSLPDDRNILTLSSYISSDNSKRDSESVYSLHDISTDNSKRDSESADSIHAPHSSHSVCSSYLNRQGCRERRIQDRKLISTSSNLESSSRTENQFPCSASSDITAKTQIPVQASKLQSSGKLSDVITNRREAKATDRHEMKTGKFETQTGGSSITIRVTGEDDRHVDNSKVFLRSEKSDNAEVTVCEKDAQDRRGNPVERTTIARGVSPHYMFPSRHPGQDESDLSRDPLSPRNSVGSTSSDFSAYSYNSSNADSAVDLGPTDDDQEFEYADFNDRFRIRTLSHISGGIDLTGIKVSGGYPVVGSLVSLGDVHNDEILMEHASRDVPADLTVGLHPLISCNSQQEFRSNSGDTSNHMTSKSQDQTSDDYTPGVSERFIPLSNQTPRWNSVKETSDSRQRFISAPEKIRFGRKCCPPHHIQNEENTQAHTNFIEASSLAAVQTDDLTNQGGTILNARPISGSECRRSHLQEEHTRTLQQEHHNQQENLTNQEHAIPQLVISDHSHAYRKQANTPSKVNFQDLDTDIASQFPSRSASSMNCSEIDHLEIEGSGLLRTSSMSSLCSITSTCSTCTASSDSALEPTSRKERSQKLGTMTTTKDDLHDASQTVTSASAEANIQPPPCSWSLSLPPSPTPLQTSSTDLTDADSDEIFVDIPLSPLSSSLRPWLPPSLRNHHGSCKQQKEIGERGITSASSSSSSMSKTSSLASINEEEVLSMMELMGEKEIISAMPPCECDECLFQEPDTADIQGKKRLKRTQYTDQDVALVPGTI